jgi:hypothetical protein
MSGRVTGQGRTARPGIATSALGEPDRHDYHLPFRRADLVAALLRDPDLVAPAERGDFLKLNRLLGSIFHVLTATRMEALRDLHHALDPDEPAGACAAPEAFAERYATFMDALVPVLSAANFAEAPADEIVRAHAEAAALRLKVSAPADDFHAVRFFRRGRGLDTFDVKDWLGLRARKIDVEVYRTVVMIAAIKPEAALERPQRERLERAQARPGSVLIKTFRNIASADLNVLLPNVRINLSWLDKLTMAVPALVGGVPIVLKLVSSLTVLFVVVGFYLGLRGGVHDDEMNTAIAALGALVALGALLIRQWVKYERRSLKYLKELTDKVYTRNLNQNAGFFDYLLSAVEDQERKEALLAFAFLRTGDEPQPPSDLRIEIENWLKRHLGVAVRFEVLDALEKLVRLGLVERTADGYEAAPLKQAVARLNRKWQALFAGDVRPEQPASSHP